MDIEELKLIIDFFKFILGCGTLIVMIVIIVKFINKISIHINAVEQIGQILGVYLYSNEDVKELPLKVRNLLENRKDV